MPLRHGIEPGMTVLEVGPGNGRCTLETARRVGSLLPYNVDGCVFFLVE